MARFIDAHDSLRQLIASGVYLAGALPSERSLERILGASRTTVRKAIARLERDGVLARTATRRARVARRRAASRMAFIAPAFAAAAIGAWEDGLRRAIAACAATIELRSLRYRSRWDPLIGEAMDACDGVFLLLGSEPVDDRMRERLVGRGLAPVLSLDQDLSAWGIPSLHLYPTASIRHLLDRVHAAGHRRIGCLNTQPLDAVVTTRIAAWQDWQTARGSAGPLVSQPVPPFADPMPRAHAAMRRALIEHRDVTAWLCTVLASARGAIRAIHDAGLVAGREVSVCTIDGEHQERFLVPSLTCVASVDPMPHLLSAVRWMLAGAGRRWRGPLRIAPSRRRLFLGESLGPAPRRPEC